MEYFKPSILVKILLFFNDFKYEKWRDQNFIYQIKYKSFFGRKYAYQYYKSIRILFPNINKLNDFGCMRKYCL